MALLSIDIDNPAQRIFIHRLERLENLYAVRVAWVDEEEGLVTHCVGIR
jgi:hypothetical protein